MGATTRAHDLHFVRESLTCPAMRVGEIWKRHAVQSGLIAGPAALILWPIYAAVQEPAWLPFLAALAVTAAAGLTIIAIACSDLLTVSRGSRVLPARLFDVALGLVLVGPAALGLAGLLV